MTSGAPPGGEHGRVGQGLHVLGGGLDAYLTRYYGSDWPKLLAARDAANNITGKSYVRLDPLCGLRMLTERVPGVAPLLPEQRKLASRVREFRDHWAHFGPISTSRANEALQLMARLLNELDEPDYRDKIAQFGRGDGGTPSAPAKSSRQREIDRLREIYQQMYLRQHPDVLAGAIGGMQLREWWEAKGHAQWRRWTAKNDTATMNNAAMGLEHQGRFPEAEAGYVAAAQAGSIPAWGNAARLFKRRGEFKAAEGWYRAGAKAGDAAAMTGLGALLHQRGEDDEARHWYFTAGATGDLRAMTAVGEFLWDTGDVAGALTWFRAAAERGDIRAISWLGRTLAAQEEWADAEPWLRRAADTGDTEAMTFLGPLLWRRDEFEEAERWARKAAQTGNPTAMTQLGEMLARRGALDEAEAWLRRAADAGDDQATGKLRDLHQQQRKAEESKQRDENLGTEEPVETPNPAAADHDRVNPAEDWCRGMAQSGDTGAMTAWGGLLRQRGRDDDAQHWYRKAAAGGNTSAMTALGELLWTLPEDPEEGGWLTRVRALAEQGEWAEAEIWFRKAADAGDTGAMGCLGALLWCTDQLEGERWLLKAAEAGNTSAMTQLGTMLEVRGALDEAEAWLCRAVDSEDRDARWWLCNFLKQNGKADEAREWEDQEPLYVGVTFSDSGHNPQNPAEDWCHTAAQAGDTGAMTALGDLLRQRGRDDEAQHWYCKAATDANATP